MKPPDSVLFRDFFTQPVPWLAESKHANLYIFAYDCIVYCIQTMLLCEEAVPCY